MEVQQLFKDLKKEAECPLCLETLKEPKTLPCLHSFCLLCLNNLARFARRKQQTAIKCPVCLASFQIPEEGSFDRFPTSFHLNRLVDILALGEDNSRVQTCSSCEDNVATCYCFDCNEFFCSVCVKVHNQMRISRSHRNVLIQNLKAQDVKELMQRPVTCAEKYHEKETLDYYCQKCKVCMCHKCVILNHKQHTVVDIHQAAEEQNVQISKVIEILKAEIVDWEIQMEKEVQLFNKGIEEIEAARSSLRTTIEGLIQGLKKHETDMNTKLDRIRENKQRCHEEQQEHFELFVTQSRSFVEYYEGILLRKISSEIVGTQEAFTGRCDELLNTKRIDLEEPPPYIRYVSNNQISQNFQGRVIASYTDSSLSVAEGQGLKEAEVGREAYFTVTTNNSLGERCYCEDDQVTVNIQTLTGKNPNMRIKNNYNGAYFVSYTPECHGQHEVMVIVNGQLLTGSPQSVWVSPHQYKYLFSFGESGEGQGEFDDPWDITVDHKTGNIAVADCGNNRIQMFNSDGEYIQELSETCSAWMTLNEPGSVAFTRSGDLLVVDSEKISLFTEAGKFLKLINSEHLEEVWRVFVAHDGCMIVCSYEDNTIKILSSDGTELLRSLAAPDCNASPDFAICHQDKVYVSYPEAQCVKVFSEEGVFLNDIGCDGCVQLQSPGKLVIDRYNNLLVCDTKAKKVHVFSLDGKFVNTIDGKLTGTNEPFSVAVSNAGCVYVIDVSHGNSIHVFQ